MHARRQVISDSRLFEIEYRDMVQQLLKSNPVRRVPAHATKDESMASTLELMHVTQEFFVDPQPSAWQATVNPNLPWAEDHFQERVGGQPLNPSPSEAWWPFARQGNAEHKKDEQFSHTYPERMWPKLADGGHSCDGSYKTWPHHGIRFEYGDLNDVVMLLAEQPGTRQAYLPIWFPEDLAAARAGERVPCSMGYHFIINGKSGELDCVYTLRSCDIVRFYRDDVYMAGRLLQWVANTAELKMAQAGAGSAARLPVGNLILHIDNLHAFPGDRPWLEKQLPRAANIDMVSDKRAGYDFGALG